jgi:tripartite-type tricarboxylate transporter receptor subunit TctC
MMTGTKMTHVPYKGSAPMLTDLLGGQVQVTFDNLPSSIEHIRAGRLRALAVSTPAPLELLPGIPTISEFLVGFETSAFAGLGAPSGTPRDIIDKLNKGVTAALADPKIKARILDLGGVPMPMAPAEFGRFLAVETEKWAKVIRAADIKPG